MNIGTPTTIQHKLLVSVGNRPHPKMPPKLMASDITACFAVTLKTLEVLADNLNTPFLGVILTTIQSLLENIEVNTTINSTYDSESQLLF
jgi:hypothetical protein